MIRPSIRPGEDEEYDFQPVEYPRNWTIAATVILACALALTAAALGVPTFLRVQPTFLTATNQNLNRLRTFGYRQVCFPDDSTCDALPNVFSQTIQLTNLLTNLRLAQLGMHCIGLSLMIIVFIGCVILILCCSKKTQDSSRIRNGRLGLGCVLMLGGFCLQTAIILFHVQQVEDKFVTNSELPYSFSQWPEAQRTTTNITYGSAYIMLWLGTLLGFIAAWILLVTYCCWTTEYYETKKLDEDLSLPRYSLIKDELSNSMSSSIPFASPIVNQELESDTYNIQSSRL